MLGLLPLDEAREFPFRGNGFEPVCTRFVQLVVQHLLPPGADIRRARPAAERVWVLKGREVDCDARRDVRTGERLECESHGGHTWRGLSEMDIASSPLFFLEVTLLYVIILPL